MNGYELSRNWFDWCFENPDKIKPNHTALYFFIIEHCNRMGWVKKFGLPTEMAKSAIGISSYNTYSKTLEDLIEWGFIEMVTKSTNQYSSNIVSLSYYQKSASSSASSNVDKALIKHVTKHGSKHGDSTDSINKQVNNRTNKQEGGEINSPTPSGSSKLKLTLPQRREQFKNSLAPFLATYGRDMLNSFYSYWTEMNKTKTKMLWEMKPTWELARRLATWAAKDTQFQRRTNANDEPTITRMSKTECDALQQRNQA